MTPDYEAIKKAAEKYGPDMSRFLRDMISHPSESAEEGEVVACIKAEMEKLGYDKVEVDGLGNVIGWMGDGDKIIAIDSHIDTVGMKAMRQMTLSTAAAVPTRKAECRAPYTAQRS